MSEYPEGQEIIPIPSAVLDAEIERAKAALAEPWLDLPDGPGWWWFSRYSSPELEMVEARSVGSDIRLYGRTWGGLCFADVAHNDWYKGKWQRAKMPERPVFRDNQPSAE